MLPHEVGDMVMDTSLLCKFGSPQRLRVGGLTFGWGVGGDGVHDLGKGVVKP